MSRKGIADAAPAATRGQDPLLDQAGQVPFRGRRRCGRQLLVFSSGDNTLPERQSDPLRLAFVQLQSRGQAFEGDGFAKDGSESAGAVRSATPPIVESSDIILPP